MHFLSKFLVLEPHKHQKGSKMMLKGGQKRKIVNNDANNVVEVLQLHQYVIQVSR